jgi:hypothetical protein
VFLGLGYKSAVWIRNKEATVIRESGIIMITPDKGTERLQKGDCFAIFAQ